MSVQTSNIIKTKTHAHFHTLLRPHCSDGDAAQTWWDKYENSL